jgi:branched-chain amino acid transport system substrate-binding protein
MKNILLYLFITINLIIFDSNLAFSKIVGNKIFFGSVISLTGKYSTEGILAQEDYNLSVKYINDMGGVLIGEKNYKFEIIYYDDESDPIRVVQLAKRLILQEGVQFMLKPYGVELTKAIMPIVQKYQIPIVGSSNALLIYKDGFEMVNSLDVKKINNVILVAAQTRIYLLESR